MNLFKSMILIFVNKSVANMTLIIGFSSVCFYSSIGMAKAALEAINGFNIYGMQVQIILEIMLCNNTDFVMTIRLIYRWQ